MISHIIMLLIELYMYVVLAFCLSSFLPFSAMQNRWVRMIYFVLASCVEPAFRFIHSVIPRRFLSVGMFDFTPILMLLGLQFFGNLLVRLVASFGL